MGMLVLFLVGVVVCAALAVLGVVDAEGRYRSWRSSQTNGAFRILTRERRRRAWFRMVTFTMLLMIGTTAVAPEDWRAVWATLPFLVMVLLIELEVVFDWTDSRELDQRH